MEALKNKICNEKFFSIMHGVGRKLSFKNSNVKFKEERSFNPIFLSSYSLNHLSAYYSSFAAVNNLKKNHIVYYKNSTNENNYSFSSLKYFVVTAAAIAGGGTLYNFGKDLRKNEVNTININNEKQKLINNKYYFLGDKVEIMLNKTKEIYAKTQIGFSLCKIMKNRNNIYCSASQEVKVEKAEISKENEEGKVNYKTGATSTDKTVSSSLTSVSSSSQSSYNGISYKLNHPMWRSEERRPFERKMDDALIFCGTSNAALGNAVADRLRTKLGRVKLSRYADGEVSMQFLDSLRGKNIYIIQPTSPPVNENLMELLLMISTCRRSSAKRITAIIPYYGYARQDRKLSSRVPISAADVARMIEAMGVDRVVAVDLHCGQIQGFFGPRVPVDNLEAQIIGLEHFTSMHLHKPVIVSPDAGGVYRARKFQEGLVARGVEECSIAMLIKQRIKANEIERMDLVGNVEDRDVIIVDDMIDTAGTLCEAAKELRNKGARRVFAFATHGLFSGKAIERIENSCLEEVVVSNTICSNNNENIKKCNRITTLSIAVLIADAIRRIHQKESLNDLFHTGN